MEHWVIYQHPADFADVPYLVRGWVITPGGIVDTGAIAFADTLEQARAVVPSGLVCITRSPDDDPVIVETWL